MSWSLFKVNIKTNKFIWMVLTCVFCFYFASIILMFDPEKTEALNEVLDMFPEGMIKALGFDEFGTTLLAFISSYMYGFLIFLFPMVLSIVINHRIIASHVDRGSMAYLLSTPNSRVRIALTQAISGLASITFFFIITTSFAIVVSEVMFPGLLEMSKFIMLNIYALLMYYSIGGIGFFASCIANESKLSLSIGVGIPVAFLVFQILGNIGEKFSWIKNLSLYTLFDPNKLIEGSNFPYIGMLAFAIIAATLYTGGILIFNKRDLPI